MSRAGEILLALRFPARAERLRDVRGAVEGAALGAGCSPECARDVVMAVDEACQNVIRHAYGGDCDQGIELEIRREGSRLRVRLRDHAPAVDPARIRARDLDDVRPGGLGVHLIHELMDETHFEPDPSGAGNTLVMAKEIV